MLLGALDMVVVLILQLCAGEVEVSPEDEAALAAFMAPDAGQFRQVSLGDLLVAKLREAQANQGHKPLPQYVTSAGLNASAVCPCALLVQAITQMHYCMVTNHTCKM